MPVLPVSASAPIETAKADITSALQRAGAGVPDAMNALFPLVYSTLKSIAHRECRRHAGEALTTTALVHETYLDLVGRAPRQWAHRGQFYAYAGCAMRSILVDRRAAGWRSSVAATASRTSTLTTNWWSPASTPTWSDWMRPCSGWPRSTRRWCAWSNCATSPACRCHAWPNCSGSRRAASTVVAEGAHAAGAVPRVTQSGASAELLERRWPQASPLLDALLDLPPESRADWLAAQPLDGELAALMQQLLASADAPGVLDADLLARVDTAEDCWQRRLGPWRVRRPIGSGGSASVYLGERADGAFEQRVAIKLLRSGVLDASERARFARERQLLARLTHPAIARLIDGGISPEGAPYLVLEYIDGLPIDRWCDARRLGVAARLRLFLDVCAAVQYAHRHLVIHRDLKPGNILVDHDGQVKLLDFGIARMLDDSAAPTETAARRMTPAYAAPEQLDGGVMSTAVDVYALGVLLHELLVGIRPQRAITLAGAARNVSAALLHSRDARASALASAVRGDLQAIVDTALQPEPGRRYPSVAALALDIERHLEGLPVGVRAAARGYRAQRWLRRHALSSTALLLLIATLSLAAWYATRQAHEAQTQALRAQAVQDFLVELLQAAGSDGGRTTPTSVDELMRLAAGRALDAFPQAPQTRAPLLRTLGRLLHEQGRLDEAERTLQAAQAVEHGELGLPAQGSLATRQALALLASVRQPEAAAATLRDVLVEQRRSHAPPGEQALTLETLGFIDSRAGRHPVALAQLREAVSLTPTRATHADLLGDALRCDVRRGHQQAGAGRGAAAVDRRESRTVRHRLCAAAQRRAGGGARGLRARPRPAATTTAGRAPVHRGDAGRSVRWNSTAARWLRRSATSSARCRCANTCMDATRRAVEPWRPPAMRWRARTTTRRRSPCCATPGRVCTSWRPSSSRRAPGCCCTCRPHCAATVQPARRWTSPSRRWRSTSRRMAPATARRSPRMCTRSTRAMRSATARAH
ncbi:MAG: protein kinase [Rhodanobacteraceae bacterium]|nr:protein kinase [Rhodanobacteraceae bacterium]